MPTHHLCHGQLTARWHTTAKSEKGSEDGGGVGARAARRLLTRPAKVFQGISHTPSPTLLPTGLKVTSRHNPYLTSQGNRGWRMGQWGARSKSPHCSTHGQGPASVSVAARGSSSNRHCFHFAQLPNKKKKTMDKFFFSITEMKDKIQGGVSNHHETAQRERYQNTLGEYLFSVYS